MSTYQEPVVPPSVIKRRRIWHYAFMQWLCTYWLLVVVISGGSAAVASKIIGDNLRDILALVVSVCSAMLATLQPQQRARSYRQGWIDLDLNIKAMEQVPEPLLRAIRRGEEAIAAEYQTDMTEQKRSPDTHRPNPDPHRP
jgi:hypothetical protein